MSSTSVRSVHTRLLCLCAVGFACGGRDADLGVSVIDSLGIEIITNTAPVWDQGEQWQVAGEPTLDIGILDGDPPYQLFRVRDALRLNDDRIVIANSGTAELRYYDADGRFLTSSGRRGQGPGEFRRIMWVRPYGTDSLAVYDRGLQRISVLATDGTFGRSFLLPQLRGVNPCADGVFRDGTLLISSGGCAIGFFGPGMATGTYYDSILYFRYADTALRDTVGWLPRADMPEIFYKDYGPPTGPGILPLPFGRTAYVAVAEHLYVARSKPNEIAVYSPSGRLQRLIRRAHAALSVTEADVERYKQDWLAEKVGTDEHARFVERIFRDMLFPSTMPAYAGIRVDSEGYVWAQKYRRPGEEQPTWTVFDQRGRTLGDVDTPPGFDIFEIGADYILGLWRDELDVEHVRMYSLVKPGSRRLDP